MWEKNQVVFSHKEVLKIVAGLTRWMEPMRRLQSVKPTSPTREISLTLRPAPMATFMAAIKTSTCNVRTQIRQRACDTSIPQPKCVLLLLSLEVVRLHTASNFRSQSTLYLKEQQVALHARHQKKRESKGTRDRVAIMQSKSLLVWLFITCMNATSTLA